MGRIPWVILLLAVGPVAGQAQMPGIRISALPERPMIERGGGQQYLNFDFSIANTTDSAREIERLELSVFDRAGRLVRRQFLWSMGSASPGFFTVPDRTVPANGALGMFNPFHVLPGDLELGRLRFEFIFSARGLEPLPCGPGSATTSSSSIGTGSTAPWLISPGAPCATRQAIGCVAAT